MTFHPSEYVDYIDNRGELIGMYIWVFNLHNEVNKKLKKPLYSKNRIDQLFMPLLSLTKDEIEEDWEQAQKVVLMMLHKIEFDYETEIETKVPVTLLLGEPHLPGLNHDPKSWGPGVWFYTFSRALRCRTEEDINDYIGYDIPILLGLLCQTCSDEAYKLIMRRHPSSYKNKVDSRGERIGMYLWISDLHNDVNKRLNKEIYHQNIIDLMYSPLLNLSNDDIEQDKTYALERNTINQIRKLDFDIDITNTGIANNEKAKNNKEWYVVTKTPIRKVVSRSPMKHRVLYKVPSGGDD